MVSEVRNQESLKIRGTFCVTSLGEEDQRNILCDFFNHVDHSVIIHQTN